MHGTFRIAIQLLFAASVAADRAVLFVRHPDSAAATIHTELERRSDPASPLYLSWLSKTDVEAMLRPDPHHLDAAFALCDRHRAQSRHVVGSDKIDAVFDGPVPREFVVEASRSEAIDVVSAAATAPRFDVALPLRRSSVRRNATGLAAKYLADPQKCLAEMLGVTGACIRKAYGLDDNATKGTGGGQAFVVNEAWLPSDLSKFQSENHLLSQTVDHIVGPNSGSPGLEGSLDSQFLTATGRGVDTTFVWLDGHAENPFTNWLTWAAKASDADLPKVHSLSVGAPEGAVGDAIIGRMNTEMAALTARGVTIVFASGDSGYQPQQKFGAASPYVTSVGGIYNGEMRQSELQADSLTTGGFASSKLNKAGSWQATAIASYTKNKSPNSAPVVPGQRAVPDVSAYDDEINVVKSGSDTTCSGTSAAAPMVAGMLASINAALLAAGHKTTLGFVNPLLYDNAAAFLDITKGDNRGVEACKGYDPISGLGTFNVGTFEALKAAALKALRTARAQRPYKAAQDAYIAAAAAYNKPLSE